MRQILVRIDLADTPQETDTLRKELERELSTFGERIESEVCAPKSWSRTNQCA
jgi:hypothetical protein